MGTPIYTHPPSLIIRRPHPLPISSTSSTSDIPGAKAKRFILWQEPKTKNLKLLQSSDLWMSPSVHPRMSHSHEARGCNRQWRPPRKLQQGHWPGGGSTWRERTWVKCTKVFWAKTAIATSEAEQPQRQCCDWWQEAAPPKTWKMEQSGV